jgi:hypothetical protein
LNGGPYGGRSGHLGGVEQRDSRTASRFMVGLTLGDVQRVIPKPTITKGKA